MAFIASALPAIAWAAICVVFTGVGLLVGYLHHFWDR